MLRRLNVSTKVRAVLAVPMVVLLVAGAYIVWGAVQDLQLARTNAAAVKALSGFEDVANALRAEEAQSEGPADSAALAKVRAATDKQLAAYQKSVRDLKVTDLPEGSQAAYTDLNDALASALASARSQTDSGTGLVTSTYQSIFAEQIDFVNTWANDTTDRPLANWISAHGALLALVNSLMSENRVAQQMFSVGVNGVRLNTFREAVATTESAKTAAGAALDGLGLDGGQVRASSSAINKLRSELAGGATETVDPAAWAKALNGELSTANTLDRTVLSRGADLANGTSRSALLAALATLAILVVAFVAAWLIASVVARAIVRPLRRLTETATEVREQLPRIVEQVAVPGVGPDIELPRIPVESEDEVGKLAAAFNDVNATTIQVAQEQAALRGSIAEMFVNVARRDQVLLNRQLAFVDSLERSEEDPTALANLFHLDHLATRMRRNAESLLVLAGMDSGRRLRESMPLSDVIRTASSEIEQYDRVELDLNVDPLMLGFNALPAAHMLAELLENASVFSEPDTPVEVSTGLQGQFVTISVLDHGIGMTEPELKAVNEKLSSTSPSYALGAQRLGLFVVAHLARKLSATVEIRRSPSGPGTETVVRFPVALFAGLEPQPVPPDRSGYAAGPVETQSYAAPTSPDAYLPEVAPVGLSADVAAAYGAQAAPAATEVDLAALTDGATDQGLPRRRSGTVREDADSGAFVLAPAVQAHELPQDLGGSPTSGFTPTIVSTTSTGLPTRRRGDEPVEVPEIPPLDLTPPVPVDPEARQSLFTGFRGWSRTQGDESEPAATPSSSPFSRRPSAEPVAELPVAEPPVAELPVAAPPVEEALPVEPAVVEPAAVEPDEPPAVPQPRRGRHGAHAADVIAEDVPFGHTKDEVARWHTGPIPILDPTEDSDWPSPTWDTAPWQPGGLFTHAAGGEGSLVPAFDPVALQDDGPYQPVAFEAGTPLAETEPAAELFPAEPTFSVPSFDAPTSGEPGGPSFDPPVYSGPAFEAPASDEAASTAVVDHPVPAEPVPGGFASAEPVVDAPEPWAVDGPAWQPVMDLSPTPLTVKQPPTVGRTWPAVLPPEAGLPAVAPEPPSHAAWAPGADVAGAWPGLTEEPAAEDWTQPAADVPAAVTPQWPVTETAAGPVADPAPAVEQWTPAPPPVAAAVMTWPSAADESPADAAKPKRKFGLFGRKAKDVTLSAAAAPLAPEATSAAAGWQPRQDETPPPSAASFGTTPTASWAPPAPVDAVAGPEPVVPAISRPPAPSSGLISFEPVAPAAPAVPDGAATPRRASLDDDVAAMLALRSDIEEQALAELSQLSAYRPSMGGSSERLTRRVPTAMPEVAPAAGSAPIRRDADELRSRLASFQSGTNRGRRTAVDTKERDE